MVNGRGFVLSTGSDFDVEAVDVEEETSTLCLKIKGRQNASSCPYCGERSERIHSWYERHPQDVAWGGRPVRLHVRVCRFFCDNPSCSRRIFSERFPDLVAPYARRTERLSLVLQAVGLLVGCSACVEIMRYLPVTTSRRTIARTLRRLVPESRPTPWVLGMDDWAIRRGHRYGTLLVDLEQGQIVEILPDREADTVAAWLQTHPGVEIISRDRAGITPRAHDVGTPQAVQVADCWHLLQNLGEALTTVLGRHRRDLKQLEISHRSVAPDPGAETTTPALLSPAFQSRNARFMQVRQWCEAGLTINAIATLSHLDRKTVRKYLNADRCPNGYFRRHRVSKLTPYQAYLLEHAGAGQRTVRQLYRDIQAQGFTGSLSTVATYLASAHQRPVIPTEPESSVGSVSMFPAARLTPRRATWLLLSSPDQLTEQQQQLAQQVAHLNVEVEQAASEAQAFSLMLRQRVVDTLDPWLERDPPVRDPRVAHFCTGHSA